MKGCNKKMDLPFIYKFENANIGLEFELEAGVVLIEGDSSTGKSYICKQIEDATTNRKLKGLIKCNFPIEKTYVVRNKSDFEKVKNKKDSLIILDRVPLYDSLELKKFVDNRQNLFIIMYRDLKYRFKAAFTEFKRLKHEIKDDMVYFTLEQ